MYTPKECIFQSEAVVCALLVGVGPLVAHEGDDGEEGGHDEGERDGEGRVLDLHLARELGELVRHEGAQNLRVCDAK